ncbi:rpgr-interacting protein 1 related [Echinococcus granulosus]|uniref:Rpgr-interacting protein 1 related n=1 Tax=Echinococcus granulosus TaxID=6210 RepID=W6UQ78_ECHGR|nr:rpgr-interacting protein 1 related [Echinococcus granulosus]EUB55519.1 rpgr-interacting protein 1 related [Echinococcus granulosus]
MKSRIKELELVVDNQNKIIRDKEEAEDAFKQRDTFAENIEMIRLKRQLAEKEKEIEHLTTQVASTREQLNLVDLEKHTLPSQPCHVYRSLIYPSIRVSNLQDLSITNPSISGTQTHIHAQSSPFLILIHPLKSSLARGSDLQTVDLLLEKLQHLERKMSASRGDREKQYEEMRRIHSSLQTRAQSAETRIEALSRRLEDSQPSRNLQELCESVGLSVKDLEAALIRMSRRREYPAGDTDADVLPWTSKTPQNEATKGAHAEAVGGLARARLPITQYRVPEEYRRAVVNATTQFDLTQFGKYTPLLEPGSGRAKGLGLQRALPTAINLGEIDLTPDQLEACPNGVFCVWRFYDFEVQSTGTVRGRRSNFNLTVQYPVITDEAFWTYLHEETLLKNIDKHCSIELHKVLPDLSSQQIGEFELGLQYLLRPESYASTNTDGTAQHSVRVSRVGRFRATKQHRDVEEGEQQHQQRIVGQVVYWVGFRAPIDRFLRDYLEQHQKKGRLRDFDEASNRSHQRGKRQLSIGLSVEEFAPQVDFCFAYTFWRCPEYVSRIYEPPATDIRLITLRDSPQLDRHLRSSSLKVLLIEAKEGSYLGMAEVPLCELAESGGSVNGTFEVHQQPPRQPKIPPISVKMEWKSVTTADERLDNPGYSSELGCHPIKVPNDRLEKCDRQPRGVIRANVQCVQLLGKINTIPEFVSKDDLQEEITVRFAAEPPFLTSSK